MSNVRRSAGNANFVSTVNSTSTPLNAAAVFTGTAEDVLQYDSVVIAVKTDQNGTYSVQFSTDGTNWDSVLTRYYRTTQIEVPHRFTITRQYFRVVFTNTSSTNQTYIRLQTAFGSKNELNAPVDSVLAQDFDSIIVRPTDFHYEVALSRRQGATTWNKFGVNADVDVGTEVLAAQGGTFTYLTNASTLTIVSSNTGDDGSPAGIGANSIVIIGIDANRISQTEVVTLNGTTSVVTSTTWLGINRAVVYLAGSSQINIGDITITATTGGSTQAFIPAGIGATQQLIFFVQDNHRALSDWLFLSATKISGGGGSPVVTFKGWVYSPVSNCKYEVLRLVIDTSSTTNIELKPSQPFIFTEKDVFWIEATTDTNNTGVSGRFSLIEVRDVDA